jgi:hypothetical protein
MLHQAFISYGSAADKPIAAALDRAICQLILEQHPEALLAWSPMVLGSLVVAHDVDPSWAESCVGAEQSLAESAHLILLASPEAAASARVNDDVAFWLARNDVERLLIVLTAGTLAWDPAANDFAWSADTPLPPALKGRFAAEPPWIDAVPCRDRIGQGDSKVADLAAQLAAVLRPMVMRSILGDDLLSDAPLRGGRMRLRLPARLRPRAVAMGVVRRAFSPVGFKGITDVFERRPLVPRGGRGDGRKRPG